MRFGYSDAHEPYYGNFSRYTQLIGLARCDSTKTPADAAKSIAGNLIEQRFIFKRFTRWQSLGLCGLYFVWRRWLFHVFGWIPFRLKVNAVTESIFGRFAWWTRVEARWRLTFHALDFTAIMVIAGCAIVIHRRCVSASKRRDCSANSFTWFCSASVADRKFRFRG